MRTRFTTEDTENAQRNTDLNAKRSENRSREHFLILKISFAFFCIFREIRGRAHFLPFSSFFSVLSVVRSDLIGTLLPEEPKFLHWRGRLHFTRGNSGAPDSLCRSFPDRAVGILRLSDPLHDVPFQLLQRP